MKQPSEKDLSLGQRIYAVVMAYTMDVTLAHYVKNYPIPSEDACRFFNDFGLEAQVKLLEGIPKLTLKEN